MIEVSANAASLHPSLDPKDGYYRRCQKVRTELLSLVRERTGCGHRLYLTTNTTSGLLTLGAFAGAAGLLPMELSTGAYPSYAEELRFLFDDSPDCRSRLLTHLSPVTGRTHDLQPVSPSTFVIVDAAQSFATSLQDELFEGAPLFVAPAHKHLGLIFGLGFVGVRDDLVTAELRDPLHRMLAVMEEGAMNLQLLQSALDRAKDTSSGGLRHNSARIHVGERLKRVADSLGLEVLTPAGLQRHIVSLRASDGGSLAGILDLEHFPGKHFKAHGIVRLSFHSDDVSGANPAELEELTASILLSSAK